MRWHDFFVGRGPFERGDLGACINAIQARASRAIPEMDVFVGGAATCC